MPDGLNKVMLIGNLGRDPEMHYTANGNAVTGFSLAVSRSWVKDGEREEQTEWVNVVTWNQLAEVVGQHLEKGRKVYIEGRLQTRSWEGTDGAKKYRTEVVADKVLFLDRAREGGTGGYVPAGDDLDPDDLPFE